ncbi:MAG TPA: helix-turn-helix domain-containing protein, partial [Pirellulales bacterium]|nr:helix-turn-helix domain-containing protein [Pirellulales bacterium]
DENLLRLEDLPLEVRRPPVDLSMRVEVGDDRLEQIERSHVLEILERERGNKARAARALGINRRSLYRLLEKYGVG